MCMEEQIRVIRSRRKTIGIQIQRNGEVVVRAPLSTSDETIRKVVREKQAWIKKHRDKVLKAAGDEPVQPLKEAEIRELADRALLVIPPKVATFAKELGVTYGRITIRNQRTRWGSCSAKGNLNFNCLLMLVPEQVLDSVIVHELCHRKVMNHSKAFYAEVLRVFPEYYECSAWLKEHGPAIMRRMENV